MPTRNKLLFLVVTSLVCAGTGCRMMTDPSCSVQREICDDRCLRCLYCPQCTTDCFSDDAWYCAPTLWTARCGPTRAAFQRVRPLPPANEIFALPRPTKTD